MGAVSFVRSYNRGQIAANKFERTTSLYCRKKGLGKRLRLHRRPLPINPNAFNSSRMLSLGSWRSAVALSLSLLPRGGTQRIPRMAQCTLKLHTSVPSRSEISARTTGKKTVNTSGGQVYYEQQGSGKHAILCIPGALGTVMSDFSPQLEHFGRADSPYTIVAFDPMGYGSSRPPDRNFATKPELFFERDAYEGHALMNSLSMPKYSVLGWSDGGISAMFLAARFPEAVQKMVIWGSNAYFTEKDVEIFEKIKDVSNWSVRMREPMEKIYGTTYFTKLWSDWVDAAVGIYKEREGGDLCKDELSKISCPTLIIHGAKDPMCPQFHAEYIHGNIAGSLLVVLPEGKHNLHLKFASQFNDMVEQFLAR